MGTIPWFLMLLRWCGSLFLCCLFDYTYARDQTSQVRCSIQFGKYIVHGRVRLHAIYLQISSAYADSSALTP
jgi:hypothetical protein